MTSEFGESLFNLCEPGLDFVCHLCSCFGHYAIRAVRPGLGRTAHPMPNIGHAVT